MFNQANFNPEDFGDDSSEEPVNDMSMLSQKLQLQRHQLQEELDPDEAYRNPANQQKPMTQWATFN